MARRANNLLGLISRLLVFRPLPKELMEVG